MKPHHFLLVGDDAYLPGALCHGANGIIAVLSNTFPLLTKNIVEGCLSAPWHENCQKWLKVCNLIDSLGNPRGIKSLLNILLGTSISLKDPLQSITEKELQNLQKELQLAGFIPTKDLV
jgi:dihydrodipicolinate synthase/N-acetylneuraminate lyase